MLAVNTRCILEKHLLLTEMIVWARHNYYRNSARHLSMSFRPCVGYKLKDNIKDCYSLLNVTEESSPEEVKGAYFKLAKMYHPDGSSVTADPRKFEQVKEAYKSIKEHQSDKADGQVFYGADEDDDDEDFDLSRLQPQHRPYLENQGIGYGTPSQRRKQYDQHRVSRASSDVSKYKIKKITQTTEENSLVLKDKKAAKRGKISNSMDRLVEDMIQESMSRGDFDNLSGQGKPLDFKQASPYTDRVTEKLNKIMIDSGVQPEWIGLHKEIRFDLHQCRERFAIEKKLLGEGPYTDSKETLLQHHAETLRKSVEDINTKIQKYNLIVPFITKQMMPYDYNKEYVKVFKNTDEYLLPDFDIVFYRRIRSSANVFTSQESGWKGVWNDFIAIFKPS